MKQEARVILLSFGNFLLSTKRDVSNNLVTHADLENWKNEKQRNETNR